MFHNGRRNVIEDAGIYNAPSTKSTIQIIQEVNMKKLLLVALVAALVIGFMAPSTTLAQPRNVTFIVNTATVPDTVGTGYTVQLRGSHAPLTWGNDTGGGMNHIGGDYWSKTLQFNQGDTVFFKIFVGSDGWEADIANVLGSVNNRVYVIANRDTTLPVQFFNNVGNGTAQYFRPWTPVADTFMNVYFRTNMLGVIQGGLFGFNNNLDTVGIRGGGPAGGDLNWSPTFYLTRESPAANGGSFGVPANTFWSGRVRMPKSGVNVGESIQYKFLIGYDWGRDELQGQPNRNFVVPTNKRDTTVYFSYFNNTRPTLRVNNYQARITYRANLQRALSTGGFAHGDTLVVRSGYFGTTTEPGKQKMMSRVGVSTIYTVIDTVLTAQNQTFDYQYYLIKNAADVRENYYNFFYSGDIPAEAERRQLIVPGNDFVINDTATSITQARRQPVFPNTRTLARSVTVRWEVNIKPAYYQVAAGDTLFDIQGSFHIAHKDSVYPAGTWINGLATGGWQTWGLTLQGDTTRKMWDDGTHGDQVAGDSIFTRVIFASPDSLGIGTKGQVGQIFKFGLKGGDNEGGRGGFGNNHSANIDDSGPTFVLRDQWGSINPAFYNRWNYDLGIPVTSVTEIPGVPYVYELKQNYPNPFNPVTRIEYSLPTASFVTLKVYNMIGQEVATLVNEDQKAAKYVVPFDGKGLASGVYFYKLNAGKFTSTHKMVLLK